MLLSRVALAGDPLDLEGPNFIGPNSFSIAKCPKYDWEEKKPQGQTSRENFSNLPFAGQRKSYVSVHNEMAAKYGSTQHIIHRNVSYESSTLWGEAKKFKHVCKRVKKGEEEHNEELDALGRAVVDEGKTIAKALINNSVEEEKIKNILGQFTDRCAHFVRNFFSK